VAGYKRQNNIIAEVGCSLGPIVTFTINTKIQTTLTKLSKEKGKEKAKAKADYD
jgi:membrane protein YqaA with SNARE-associated domain